jgi:hypothetical protein
MMLPIVIGSTIKDVLTGLAAGLVARRRKSLALGITTGVVVGFALSIVAALGQPDHYWTIVLPGMLVGALTGVATHRVRTVRVIAIALCVLSAASAAAAQQASSQNQRLSALDPLIGRRQGTTEGQPGKGTVEREYSRLLNSRFVYAKNRSLYPPQERNPKGKEHEDRRSIRSTHRRRVARGWRPASGTNYLSLAARPPYNADQPLWRLLPVPASVLMRSSP